jgi:hypothetical protein
VSCFTLRSLSRRISDALGCALDLVLPEGRELVAAGADVKWRHVIIIRASRGSKPGPSDSFRLRSVERVV